MDTVSEPAKLDSAWNKQYTRLAQQFSRLLTKQGVLVEIGCGNGQLTIPLSFKIPRVHIIGVDSFKGPYRTGQSELLTKLAARRKKPQVSMILNDYYRWLQTQPDSKYDAVISSEFLPELDSARMRDFFVSCHRVVKSGGGTIHSFLSPQPRNVRQRRLIEADSDPEWTKTPPPEWFSPTTSQVVRFLERAGFDKPRTLRIRSGLLIRSAAARQMLIDWDVRRSYWSSHRTELEEEGLEVPDWIIIEAKKLA